MPKTIETLRRGLEILALVQQKGPISQAIITRETGLSKAVVHRMLYTLQGEGFVRVALGDQLWRATDGPNIAPEPTSAEALARASVPALLQLSETVFWPSDVATYTNGAMRIVEHTRKNTPFVISRIVAPRLHVLPSALGRAIVAWSTPQERAKIFTQLGESAHVRDKIVHDTSAVESMIAKTLELGYATRDPSHFGKVRRTARISEIAVPVFHKGTAIAAINLCWATSAMSENEFVQENISFLRDAANEISQTLVD